MPWQDFAGVSHPDPEDVDSSMSRLFGNLMAIQERKRQNAIQDQLLAMKQQEFQREQEDAETKKQKNLLELASALAALKSGTVAPAKKLETPEISTPTGTEVAPHVTQAEMPLSERTDLDTEGIPTTPAGTPESIPLAPKQTLEQPAVPAQRESFRLRIPGLAAQDIELKNKEEAKAEQRKRLEEAGIMGGHLVRLEDGSLVPASVAAALVRNEGKTTKPTNLQHVSRTLPSGIEQQGTFDPSTGEYKWSGGVGGGGMDTGRVTDLSQIPEKYRSAVQAIGEYRDVPATFVRGSSRQQDQIRNQLMQWVHDVYPDYDFSQAPARVGLRKEFTSGQYSKNLTALNTAERHLRTLEEKAKALPGHGGLPGATGLNWLQAQLSKSAGRPGITDFEGARTKVADEVTKAFTGAGAMAEQNVMRELSNLSSSMSADQINSQIDTIRKMLQGRRQELKATYERGIGHPMTGKDVNEIPGLIEGEIDSGQLSGNPSGSTKTGAGGASVKWVIGPDGQLVRQ